LVALISGSGFRETFCTKEKAPLKKRTLNIKELGAILS
jgi:hypothetical protein